MSNYRYRTGTGEEFEHLESFDCRVIDNYLALDIEKATNSRIKLIDTKDSNKAKI